MNTYIFFFIVSLFAVALIAAEFFVARFFVSSLQLDKKYKRPREVIALMAVEIVTILMSINNIKEAPVMFTVMLLFFGAKLMGLWTMKKWVIYLYVASNIFSWGLSTFLMREKNITSIILMGLVGSILILYFSYIQVYIPNKEKFV
jgi:hypothetical protein